ncbi:MAG: sulfatase [Phycisphaerae bacterium]|nr:sulfatase [Phycisphaerae bacterium]
MNRRKFLNKCNVVGISLLTPFGSLARGSEKEPAKDSPNFILITADDLNYDSVGCYGCKIPGITPHLDRMASQGMTFTNAHVNIAVCQPSRQSIMTGRYPHCNGAEGFEPIDPDVPTLQESLHNAGYLNGILGKEIHLRPKNKYCWDFYITQGQLASGAGIGRSPELYYSYSKSFFELAKDQNKPFFLMANFHDPHRPFAGSDQEKRAWGHDLPKATRKIKSSEVPIPDFLPDLPGIRKEVADYYTSVYRCDQSVGAVIRALEESGLQENTIVMFISDNGMSVPFSKANCYLNSTKTPWLVTWPGRVTPGSVDSKHFISGIDYMPTVLDIAGIKAVGKMNGFSFLPLLSGKDQQGRQYVFTEFHKTFAGRCFPMRCVQNERFGYIFNFWAGKTKPMRMDSTSGLTFKAMQEAGKSNPQIAARVALFEHRVPEEFYDFKNDPGALHNLISAPQYQTDIEQMRRVLKDQMARTKDLALPAFVNRDNPTALDDFMNDQQTRARRKKQ